MKPFQKENVTYLSRTRSAQRRINENKSKIRKSVSTSNEIICLPEDSQSLFDEMQKLTNEISRSKLKQDIDNILKQITENTKSMQKNQEAQIEDIQRLDRTISEKDIEIKSLQENLVSKQKHIDDLVQEGDKQIKDLTKVSKNQIEEIKLLMNTIECLRKENEDQKEIIISTEEENQGLSLAVTSLNNAIGHNKRKSLLFLKNTFNNSLNFSLLDSDETLHTNKTLQHELDDIAPTNSIISKHSEISTDVAVQSCKIGSDIELANKNADTPELTRCLPVKEIPELTTSTKDNTKEIQDKVDNHKTINNQEELHSITAVECPTLAQIQVREIEPIPEKSLCYLTPRICIENNKELQKELENENIINKQKKGTDTMNNQKNVPYKNQEKPINYNEIITIDCEEEMISNQHNMLEQLENITKKLEMNTEKIRILEEKMSNNKNTTKTLQQKINLEQQNSSQTNLNSKINCFIVGDSHLRYIDNEIKTNMKFTKHFNFKFDFVPGHQMSDIIDSLIPDNIKKEDILIISGGTNDLFYTSTEEIKKYIDVIGKIGCSTYIISVPPQRSQYYNKHISGLNTVIKYQAKKFPNLHIINTHKFIQPHHLAKDGIHLGRIAKKWLASKITNTLEKLRTGHYNRKIEKN